VRSYIEKREQIGSASDRQSRRRHLPLQDPSSPQHENMFPFWIGCNSRRTTGFLCQKKLSTDLPIAVPRLAMWRTAAAQVSILKTPSGTWRGNTSVSRDACLDEDSFEIIMRRLTKIRQGSSSWV